MNIIINTILRAISLSQFLHSFTIHERMEFLNCFQLLDFIQILWVCDLLIQKCFEFWVLPNSLNLLMTRFCPKTLGFIGGTARRLTTLFSGSSLLLFNKNKSHTLLRICEKKVFKNYAKHICIVCPNDVNPSLHTSLDYLTNRMSQVFGQKLHSGLWSWWKWTNSWWMTIWISKDFEIFLEIHKIINKFLKILFHRIEWISASLDIKILFNLWFNLTYFQIKYE